MNAKIYVIGIGYKPLDKRAREIILNSNLILASNRLSEVFKGYDEFEAVKDKIKVINNVDETMEFIRAEVQRCRSIGKKDFRTSELPNFHSIVLLASGDPTFFGIGRRAVREFGKDMVEIIPGLSCIQIAFSRVKESWDDAFLMSLHGGPHPEKRRRLPYEINDIPSLLQRHNKIAVLTDKQNNPSEIAKELLKPSALPHFRTSALKIYVCEKLGYEDERITEGTPDEISAMTFREPNVVIIIREQEQRPERAEVRFGLKEDEIIHSKGLITKDEVRAVTIHKLRLPQKGVFWDIGAGSGSVSVEVARLCADLKVFAIDKNEEQINHLKENKIRFNAANIKIIKGEAPEVLKTLPLPDRVFIGGSGKKLKDIIRLLADVMTSGVVVVNAAKIETLGIAVAELQSARFEVDLAQVTVARGKVVGDGNYLSALNPIFIIRGERREKC